MKKSGFVYIWFDRKHSRYYIGSHWGSENDGYICSSNWMRDAYRRRTEDFKRKIITRIDSSYQELLVEEEKWLSLIKDEELGKRYYNLNNKRIGHWTTNKDTRSIRQKIGDAHRGKTISIEHKEALAEGSKKAIKRMLENGTHPFLQEEVRTKQIESTTAKLKGIPRSQHVIEACRQANIGRKFSEEHKTKLSIAKKGKPSYKKGIPNDKYKGSKFFNNGKEQKMFFEGSEPNGWIKGRLI